MKICFYIDTIINLFCKKYSDYLGISTIRYSRDITQKFRTVSFVKFAQELKGAP